MQAAGVNALRMDVQWARLEPTTKGTYAQNYLTQLDYAVNGLVARGIKTLMTVDRTPAWANSNLGQFAPPTNDQDYADFLVFLINRYTGKVNDFEIWNEPNLSQFWLNPNPVRYTALLKIAYTSAKAANPQVNILGGSISNTTSSGTTFLTGMYQAGAKAYFDTLSQHIYGDIPNHGNLTPETLFDTLTSNILPIMQNNGDGSKRIWITEHGYNTALTGVSESVQADYLARSYTKVKTISSIDSLYYYSWMNASTWDTGCNCAVTDSSNPEQNYGLVKVDVSQKPAFTAYKNMTVTTQIPTIKPTVPPNLNTPTPTRYCCKSTSRGCRKWCYR
jgi:hypothetical protein